jgi:hypothetical protein
MAVREHSGEVHHLGDPPPVILPFELDVQSHAESVTRVFGGPSQLGGPSQQRSVTCRLPRGRR